MAEKMINIPVTSVKTYMHLLLALFFVTAVCYSLLLPDWQNSDEPFHFIYIRTLVKEHRFPRHEETYQAAHPPLYYTVAAAWAYPFRNRTSGFLDNWIRLLSVLMGTVTIFIIYRTGRDFLDSEWLGACMATLAAVNPSFVVMNSVVNNDAGVILACTATFYLMLRWTAEGGSMKAAVLSGIAAGICCLVKISANLMVVFFCVYYFFLPGNLRRGWFKVISELAVFALVFLAVCAWWTILGYYRIGDRILFNPVTELNPNPLHIPVNLFWFARISMSNVWMPMDYLRGFPHDVHVVMKILYFGASCVCAGLIAASLPLSRKLDRFRRHIIMLFAFSLLVYLAQMYVYNLKIHVAQARYMFIIISPVAAMISFSLSELAGRRFRAVVFFSCAGGFAIHCIWAFVYIANIAGPGFNI